MWNLHRSDKERSKRTLGLVCLVGLAMVSLIGLLGCASTPGSEQGYSDQCRTQIQFYSPPGSTVTVMGGPTRSHQIAQYGAYGHRLEHSPEEFSVFNLAPGRYEFKYTTADGLPGVSVYGELDVQYADTHEARVFQRRAFVPIALPSEYYRRVEAVGNEIYPYRGEAFRTAIDEQDLQRLKQGDVIEKVIFVADLERADKVLEKTERDIAVCEREMEYADARFRLAYYDFRTDVMDPAANFFGTDKNFIRWERERKREQQRLGKLVALRKRTQALIKGDRVLVRKGMLVLATQEVVEPHRDVVDASDDLGEVMLVMRVGGRHMQWGDPAVEARVSEK